MNAHLFLALLRRERAVTLSGLALVVAIAWIYLALGAGIDMEVMDMGGGAIMAMPPLWTAAYAALVFIMWAVMMVAMMLPSAAPTILLAAALSRQRSVAANTLPAVLFALGYVAVWTGFSLLATLLQWALDRAGLLSEMMASNSVLLAGLMLIAAGLYQWTPLKQACLAGCRSPADFLARHWRDGAFRAGLRHGVVCLGCCWMLMALLFVGGLMNLVWIGALALLVLAEKTLPWGGRLSRLLGAALMAWGGLTLLHAGLTAA